MSAIAPSTARIQASSSSTASRVLRASLPYLFLAIALGVALATPGFATVQNVSSALTLASVTGICAVGLSLVTISGNLFSLSTTGTAVVTAIAFALLTNAGAPFLAALFLCLGLGIALGAVQGALVALGLNPIVITLAVGTVLIGAASVMTGGQTLNLVSEDATAFGRTKLLDIPVQIVCFVALSVILGVIVARHRWGREMTLTGSSPATARSSGLRPALIAFVVFSVSSAFISLAAVLQTSQFGQANVTQFPTLTFDAITAILVGGLDVRGGRGNPLNVALGAIFVALVQNVMLLNGASIGVRVTVEGVVVGLVVLSFWLSRSRGLR